MLFTAMVGSASLTHPTLADKQKSQRDRFIETARKLGADEDEAAFKAKLAVIARQKPKDDPESSGGKSGK